MATTGQDFDNIFQRKIDKAYSGFYNPTKRNNLYKEALILSIEDKYKELDEQKEYDELAAIIRTKQVFTPSSNAINTTTAAAPNIPDYKHLLAIKQKYEKRLTAFTITNATNKSPIVVTVSARNNLRTGEQIKISGVVGNTAANATHFIKVINSTQIQVFSDAKLTIPVAGNGDYESGGVIDRIFYNYAKPLFSDRKIGRYGQPTVSSPKFETGDNQLKFYPDTETCTEITIDYISDAVVFIDATDNSTDLELTYPFKFLTYIADKAARLFSMETRDAELFQTEAVHQAENQ